MTNAAQPAFSAYLSAPVANATGDGTKYTVICDTTLTNQASAYNTSTGVFTAPVTGIYTFNGTLYWTSIGVGYINVLLRQNSTDYNLYVLGGTAAFSGQICTSYTLTIPCTVGDTVSLIAQGAGTTKTMGINGNASVALSGTMFCGFLVC